MFRKNLPLTVLNSCWPVSDPQVPWTALIELAPGEPEPHGGDRPHADWVLRAIGGHAVSVTGGSAEGQGREKSGPEIVLIIRGEIPHLGSSFSEVHRIPLPVDACCEDRVGPIGVDYPSIDGDPWVAARHWEGWENFDA